MKGKQKREKLLMLATLFHQSRRSRPGNRWFVILFLGLGIVLPGRGTWLQAQGQPEALSEMEIERLLNIEVISASKREQPLFHAASAIFVITPADIRRSGAANIPDLLRLVPGMQVSQLDSKGWAISARGFAERYSNKLLVLVDGRTVYDPLFSGVYWDAQNVMLEDIERIEVVRGPGATLWGANAVNGVINIITRSSADTQGSLVSVSVGSNEPANTSLRYGGRLGTNTTYRVYGNYFRRDRSVGAGGTSNQDDWEAGRGGFRADWKPSAADSFTLEGEMIGRGGGETLALPSLTPPFQRISSARQRHRGSHLLGRWNHILPKGGDWSLQGYYDRVFRETQALDERLDTVDVDFQHHRKIRSRQDLIWGFGYRATIEDYAGKFILTVPSDTGHRLSMFLQDDITVVPYRLQVIAGTKFERDPHGGWNTQPSLRLLWTPSDRQAAWAAVSRALRTPTDFEVDSRINAQVLPNPPGPVNLVSVFGNKNIRSEELIAYELGYRWSPHNRFSLDMATFYNVYDDLETTEPIEPFFETSPAPPHVVIAQQFGNLLHGETYGVEVAASWNVSSRWSLSASYSRLEIQLHLDPASRSTNAEIAEHTSPDHEFQVRSHWVLPWNVDLDLSLEQVSKLSALAVPGYTRLDAQWMWSPGESVHFAFGAQNLLTPRHMESGNFRQIGVIGQAERNFYGKLSWRF